MKESATILEETEISTRGSPNAYDKAMILLLGSQAQMYAQKKPGPANNRPGMEVRDDRRAGAPKPGGPMIEKAICQNDIRKVQDYYWMKYGVRLSKKEAEKFLIVDMRERGPAPGGPKRPHRR